MVATLVKAGYGAVLNDMTMYDMCFHFADLINTDSYNNYCANTSKEDSFKNPFFYPFCEPKDEFLTPPSP